MITEFSSNVEVPYDLRFMPIVQDYVRKIATLAGGSGKEADALNLAVDETMTFLINSYSTPEAWERIKIGFSLYKNNTLEVSITNAGPPVHLNRIPQYNPQSPDNAELDGLWLFLAQQAVDEITFHNRGRHGWQVTIRKQLAAMTFQTSSAKEVKLARKTPFITRLATPDDAASIVDLTYDTYRYSYLGETFYHEPELKKLLKSGEIISIVVEADGHIVGNSSFFIKPDKPRCAYSGSMMIKPAYRQSQAIIHLLKEIDRRIEQNFLNVDLYYGSTVTTHTGSQKAGLRVGFQPVALYLSICGAMDFKGMRSKATERESGVAFVRIITAPRLSVMYFPEQHHKVMSGLLAQIGIHCQISGLESPPVDDHSECHITEMDHERCAYLMLTKTGKDWTEFLRRKIFTLKSRGIQTIIIYISANVPTPPELDRKMAGLNAIFSGILPMSADECYMIYSALSCAIDFDRILLHDPLAYELKEHCRQLYNDTFTEHYDADQILQWVPG